jgi:hypothetical protein
MQRVIIIGDSQVSALIKVVKEYPDLMSKNKQFKFDFFAAPGPIARKLKLEDGRLGLVENLGNWNHPSLTDETLNKWYKDTQSRLCKIDGRPYLDLGLFDIIVFFGGGLTCDDWFLIPSEDFYSLACKAKLCEELTAKTTHYSWVSQLKGDYPSKAIISLASPLINQLDPKYMKKLSSGQKISDVINIYSGVLSGLGTIFLQLPNSLLNKEENATSSKYKTENRDHDYVHLNSDGGKLVMESIFSHIEKLNGLDLV